MPVPGETRNGPDRARSGEASGRQADGGPGVPGVSGRLGRAVRAPTSGEDGVHAPVADEAVRMPVGTGPNGPACLESG
jgi:hypothetical protein